VAHYLAKKNVEENDCLFFGDSLNDQAMFKSFKNSVGVSNISKVIDQLKYRPATILLGEENIGPFGVFNYLNQMCKTFQ
jgi:phosphoserine phosphatase